MPDFQLLVFAVHNGLKEPLITRACSTNSTSYKRTCQLAILKSICDLEFVDKYFVIRNPRNKIEVLVLLQQAIFKLFWLISL